MKKQNITSTPEQESSLPSANSKKEAKYPNYHQYLGKIVKLQALFRGHIIRKNYPRTLFTIHRDSLPDEEQNKEPEINEDENDEDNEQITKETFVENMKFQNGAIYTG